MPMPDAMTFISSHIESTLVLRRSSSQKVYNIRVESSHFQSDVIYTRMCVSFLYHSVNKL